MVTLQLKRCVSLFVCLSLLLSACSPGKSSKAGGFVRSAACLSGLVVSPLTDKSSKANEFARNEVKLAHDLCSDKGMTIVEAGKPIESIGEMKCTTENGSIICKNTKNGSECELTKVELCNELGEDCKDFEFGVTPILCNKPSDKSTGACLPMSLRGEKVKEEVGKAEEERRRKKEQEKEEKEKKRVTALREEIANEIDGLCSTDECKNDVKIIKGLLKEVADITKSIITKSISELFREELDKGKSANDRTPSIGQGESSLDGGVGKSVLDNKPNPSANTRIKKAKSVEELDKMGEQINSETYLIDPSNRNNPKAMQAMEQYLNLQNVSNEQQYQTEDHQYNKWGVDDNTLNGGTLPDGGTLSNTNTVTVLKREDLTREQELKFLKYQNVFYKNGLYIIQKKGYKQHGDIISSKRAEYIINSELAKHNEKRFTKYNKEVPKENTPPQSSMTNEESNDIWKTIGVGEKDGKYYDKNGEEVNRLYQEEYEKNNPPPPPPADTTPMPAPPMPPYKRRTMPTNAERQEIKKYLGISINKKNEYIFLTGNALTKERVEKLIIKEFNKRETKRELEYNQKNNSYRIAVANIINDFGITQDADGTIRQNGEVITQSEYENFINDELDKQNIKPPTNVPSITQNLQDPLSKVPKVNVDMPNTGNTNIPNNGNVPPPNTGNLNVPSRPSLDREDMRKEKERVEAERAEQKERQKQEEYKKELERQQEEARQKELQAKKDRDEKACKEAEDEQKELDELLDLLVEGEERQEKLRRQQEENERKILELERKEEELKRKLERKQEELERQQEARQKELQAKKDRDEKARKGAEDEQKELDELLDLLVEGEERQEKLLRQQEENERKIQEQKRKQEELERKLELAEQKAKEAKAKQEELKRKEERLASPNGGTLPDGGTLSNTNTMITLKDLDDEYKNTLLKANGVILYNGSYVYKLNGKRVLDSYIDRILNREIAKINAKYKQKIHHRNLV